ncbi:MAG: HEAT repeat domain-containing protein [Caldilineaceae bacterium]
MSKLSHMKKSTVVCGYLLSWFLWGCSPITTECQYSVIVRDEITLKEIPKAKGLFYGDNLIFVEYTDENGYFNVTSLPCVENDMNIRLTVTASGYKPYDIHIAPSPTLDIRLTPLTPYNMLSESILKIDPDIDTPELLEFMADTNPVTRGSVASELSRRALHIQATSKQIITALMFTSENDSALEVRKAAIRSLGDLGLFAEEALPLLEKIAGNDKSIDVRQAAAEAVNKILASSKEN